MYIEVRQKKDYMIDEFSHQQYQDENEGKLALESNLEKIIS